MRLYLSESIFKDEHFEIVSELYNRHAVKTYFLTSYYYHENIKTGEPRGNQYELIERGQKSLPYDAKFMLDSGVFSARKKDEKIDNERLSKYFHRNEHLYDSVFNNDDGPVKTQIDNLKYLSENDVPVIGIYHPGAINDRFMGLEHLEKMFEYTDFCSIALHTIPKNDQPIIFKEMFDFIYKNGYQNKKMHLLGVESPAFLYKYPFYSTDATTFLRDYIMGRVSKWDSNRLRIVSSAIKNETKYWIENDVTNIERVGPKVDPRIARIEKSINNRSYYQQFLTNLWKKRGVEWS